MKRLFSFLLALAMLATMSISVFADDTINKENEIISTDLAERGTITISNATATQKYVIYKVFDAEITADRTETNPDGIIYTLEPGSAVCQLLFGTKDNPVTPADPYFTYDWDSHRVTLINPTNNGVALVDYIKEKVLANKNDFPSWEKVAVAPTNLNEETELEFQYVQYGYYLIERVGSSVATVNSCAPTMTVIDKNQMPGNADKTVKKGDEAYATNNTVNIGDVVTYKIAFTATNYSGQEKVQYYEVFDVKGTGIWAEFNKFEVSIGGQQKRGYYLGKGGKNTNDWAKLGAEGAWAGFTDSPEHAEWFLVHTGFDTYSILIPWVTPYDIQTANDQGKLFVTDVIIPTAQTPEENVSFKYGSPMDVVITYTAAIEPNATVNGGNSNTANLFNEATVHWKTNKGTEDSSETDKVYSETYGLTVLKKDLNGGAILEGAKFAVYGDNQGAINYNDRIYVIPTGVDGVYMVDSKGTDAEKVSGTYMETARKYFEYLRNPDGQYVLKDVNDPTSKIENAALKDLGNNQTNEVVTAANGRLVILGLDLGTYHFVETEAPQGYNKLENPFTVTVAPSSTPYYIYTDAEGNVLVDSTKATYTYTYKLTQEEIGNSKGVSLPSTGGEGRMMLISVGSMIAMAFAVLLITQKKMSIYKD